MKKNKSEPTANPEPDNNKLGKKTGKLPNKQAAIADLGKEVARSWLTNFPQMQMPLLTWTDLDTAAQELLDNVNLGEKKDLELFQNSQTLKTTNSQANKLLSYLKKYLKGLNPSKKDYADDYKAYGLSAGEGGIFALSVDNNNRIREIARIVEKLQEPNNPIAGLEYGLTAWQQVAISQKRLWDSSNQLREERSEIAKKVLKGYSVVREMLIDVHGFIPFQFGKADAAKTRRSFGFLKESF